jgi:hypothetical protein
MPRYVPFDPGYGDDLVVTITDPVVFARWHLGLIEWTAALRSGGLDVTGVPGLRRALPTWNGAPAVFAGRRAGIGLPAGAATGREILAASRSPAPPDGSSR